MNAEAALRSEYEALLRSEGLKPPSPPSKAELRSLQAMLTKEELALLGDAVSEDGLFEHTATDLRRTLAEAEIAVPGPVLVGEYPHESFNAEARAVRSGTLILVSTGFAAVVHEFSKAHGMSLRTFSSRDEYSEPIFEPATPEDRRREHVADAALASSVLAYLTKGDARRGMRLPLDVGRSVGLAFRLAEATERFVIAHEFAHLVEGHLGTAAERESHDWLHRTREQEFQADETGALLCLRALQDPNDQVIRCFAVAGPLFFLAIDHLITRIRNELDNLPQGMRLSDHPTSDERGAALRALFVELYGHSVLNVADAVVHWLSWHEDRIVAAARRMLPG